MLLKYQQKKPIYVLVHGAWHGSWCWRAVQQMFYAHNDFVIAPDLPGHHKNSMSFVNIRLKTYVHSLSELVKNQVSSNNKKVVLVGHNMAGAVISQVAENIPECIQRLVYISAFIPEDGSSIVEEQANMIVSNVMQESMIDKENHCIALQLSPRLLDIFYSDCSMTDQNFALRYLQKQPLYPLNDPVSLSIERFGNIPKTYIECLADQVISIADQRRTSAKLLNCNIISLDTSHSPFFSRPHALYKMLDSFQVTSENEKRTTFKRA
jgi:pimeloyl-ACP methyl ester carboxylesterase